MANALNDLPDEQVEGEVPAIPVQEDAPAAEAEETAPEVDETPDPAKLQAEIETLKQKKEDLQEKSEYWRKQYRKDRTDAFMRQKQEPQAPAQLQAETQQDRPKPEDFEDYNDYVDKLTDWKVEQREQAWAQQQQQQQQNTQYQQKMTALEQKILEGHDKYDDFADVALNETVPITQMVMDVLAEMEHPADVAYYLGKNQTEAISISRMTPIGAARALANIESQISNNDTVPAPKPTTKAPPPIKPVGQGAAATNEKDPETMTQAEYEAWRKKQGAKPY